MGELLGRRGERSQLKTPQTCYNLSILPACCNLAIVSNRLDNFIKFQQVILQLVMYRLVTACSKQQLVAASLWITRFDNKFGIKLSQAMRANHGIGLFMKSVL